MCNWSQNSLLLNPDIYESEDGQLELENEGSFETPGSTGPTAQLHIPDDWYLQQHSRDNPKSRIYAQIHKKPNLDLSPPQTTAILSAHFFKTLHYCHHKYAQARLPRIFRLQFLIPRENYESLPSQHCHLIRRRASLCMQFYPSAGYCVLRSKSPRV